MGNLLIFFEQMSLLIVTLILAATALVAASDGELVVDVIEAKECTRKTQKGDKLSMHYTGTLADGGKKFDSSRDRNSPFKFTLGVGQVIQGWDQGLVGRCIGDKLILNIPANLGYGARGAGGVIPPN